MSAHQQTDFGTADLVGQEAWERRPQPTPRKPAKSAARGSWTRVFSAGAERHIEDEESFLQLLSLERKRSERSGKRFLLVLLEGPEVLQGAVGQTVVKQIQRGVLSSIRDIDVPGWYEDEAALGIIFTEMGEAQPAVVSAIVKRICDALVHNVDAAHAKEIAVTWHVFPDYDGGKRVHHADLMRFYPDVPRARRERQAAHLAKRAIDVAGSLFALTLLAPIMLLIAALIKLTSPGPVFFRQPRVGQFGIPFTFLKFRSMHVNNDPKIHQQYVASLIAGKVAGQGGATVFKIKNDPRVTRLGRILRKTSLDELPQFINVLKGEMSLVGPRPPIDYEVDRYEMWHRRRVLEVKPGITGLWQVEGRSKVTFDQMVRLDLKYARKWTIGMDLKILLMTPKAVVSGDGAC